MQVPPAGSLARYRVQEMLGYINSELHKSYSPLFNPKTPAETREERIEYLRKRYAFIEQTLAGKDYRALVESAEVAALIQPFIDQVNTQIAKWETVKKFQILPRDLTVEEGELTPSLKVKRKAVEKKYVEVLDEMYQGAMADV